MQSQDSCLAFEARQAMRPTVLSSFTPRQAFVLFSASKGLLDIGAHHMFLPQAIRLALPEPLSTFRPEGCTEGKLPSTSLHVAEQEMTPYHLRPTQRSRIS